METRLKLPLAKHPLSIAMFEEMQQNKQGQKIKFVNPNTDNYEANIRSCAKRRLPMAPKMLHEGETAVVCGSGPSLKDPDVLDRIRSEQEDGAVIYACKSAIKFLSENGIKPDYGVSMDPGAHIADPRKILKVPGVVHIIASTSDPAVFDYLLGDEYGDPAAVWVFHSATGFQSVLSPEEYAVLPIHDKRMYTSMKTEEGDKLWAMSEKDMYDWLFPNGDVMTGGFNVVNRAVSLAMYMGARKIILAGADSGWRDGEVMYCDATPERPGVNMSDKGRVDGVNWNTRPDMLASAVSLAKLARQAGPEEMEIIGDTLPASLMRKDDDFLAQVASF